MGEIVTTLNDDKAFHNKLDEIMIASRSRTESFTDLYSDALRYMYGHQIHGKREEGWEYPVINQIYPDLTQEVAMLSANQPRLQTSPVEDTDIEAAKACGEILQAYWVNDLNMQMRIMQALYDAKQAGMYIFKFWWEPKQRWNKRLQHVHRANGEGIPTKVFESLPSEEKAKYVPQDGAWEGDLRVEVIDPFYFGFDPNVEVAARIPFDAEYVTIKHYIPMEKAAARWPIYKDFLKQTKGIDQAGKSLWVPGGGDSSTDETGADVTSGDWHGREKTELNAESMQRRLADLLLGKEPVQYGGKAEGQGMVEVEEIYWKDRSVETVEAQSEDMPTLSPGESRGDIFKPHGDVFHYDRSKPIEQDGAIVGYERFKGKWPKRQVAPAYEQPTYPNGRVSIRVDHECVVEDRAWPYSRWMVSAGVNYMLPHIANGLNGVEMLRSLQDYTNNIHCHTFNIVRNFSDPTHYVEEGAYPAKKKPETPIVNKPGKTVFVATGANRQKKIYTEDGHDIPIGLLRLHELFKEASKDNSGIHDVAQGKASGTNTLGELQMLNRSTRLRVGMQGLILDDSLRGVGQGCAELIQHHLPIHRWVRRLGPERGAMMASVQWTQSLKEARYDVFMETASTLPYDEERELAKYKEALNVAGPELMMEAYLQKLGISNIAEIMTKHPLVAPFRQLLEMAKQMGMGSEELLAAIQAQLAQIQPLLAPAQGGPGAGAPPQGAQSGEV